MQKRDKRFPAFCKIFIKGGVSSRYIFIFYPVKFFPERLLKPVNQSLTVLIYSHAKLECLKVSQSRRATHLILCSMRIASAWTSRATRFKCRQPQIDQTSVKQMQPFRKSALLDILSVASFALHCSFSLGTVNCWVGILSVKSFPVKNVLQTFHLMILNFCILRQPACGWRCLSLFLWESCLLNKNYEYVGWNCKERVNQLIFPTSLWLI